MIDKKTRHAYYLRGLTAPLIAFLAMFFFQASLFSISTFLICYLWPYFIFTPGAKARYQEFRYRWSMAGLLVRLQEVLENGLPGYGLRRNFAIAISSPLIVCLILWLLTGSGEPLFALAGCALFALVYRFLLWSIVSEVQSAPEQNLANELPVEILSEPNPPVQNHQTDNDSGS